MKRQGRNRVGSIHHYFHSCSPPLSDCTDEKLLLLDRDGIIGRPCLFMAFIFLEIAGENDHSLSRSGAIFLRQDVDPRFIVCQLRSERDVDNDDTLTWRVVCRSRDQINSTTFALFVKRNI